MNHIHRRELLRGTGVAALAAGAAVIPIAAVAVTEDPDAELRRLWCEYTEALDALEAAKVLHRPRRKMYDEEFDARKDNYHHEGGFGQLHNEVWKKHKLEQTYRHVRRAHKKLSQVTKAVRKAEAHTLFGIGVKLSVTEHFEQWDVVDSAENAREAISKLVGYDFAARGPLYEEGAWQYMA